MLRANIDDEMRRLSLADHRLNVAARGCDFVSVSVELTRQTKRNVALAIYTHTNSNYDMMRYDTIQ